MYIINTTITVEFILQPDVSPPAEADYDIIVITPAGVTTYTSSALTTYSAPTSTEQGLGTFDILVDELGRYEVKLVIGNSSAYQDISEIDLFVVVAQVPVIDSQYNRKVTISPVELTYQEQVLLDLPIGYWNLDEITGSVGVDQGSGGNDVVFAAANQGNAALINTGFSAEVLDVGPFVENSAPTAALQILGDVTLEAWINLYEIAAGNRNIMSTGDPGESSSDNILWTMGVKAAGELRFLWEFGGGTNEEVETVGGIILIDTTYHVVGVRNATTKTVIFYVNGVAVGSPLPYVNDATNGTNINLDLGSINGAAGVNGLLDQPAVYDYVLSPARVLAHYNAGIL